MNYSKMTDFEINKAVAIACGYPEENCEFGWEGKHDVGVEWNEETGYPTKSFNYCNSWADAGPVIERNKITLYPDETETFWISSGLPEKGFTVTENHKNPLRAAMIVFLMMQEGK